MVIGEDVDNKESYIAIVMSKGLGTRESKKLQDYSWWRAASNDMLKCYGTSGAIQAVSGDVLSSQVLKPRNHVLQKCASVFFYYYPTNDSTKVDFRILSLGLLVSCIMLVVKLIAPMKQKVEIDSTFRDNIFTRTCNWHLDS